MDMGGHGRTRVDTVQVTSRLSSADSKECRNWNGIRFDRNTFQSSGQSNNSDLGRAHSSMGIRYGLL